MALNWKIRMLGTGQYTPWYGTGWNTPTDDDLDKIASALGVSKDDCAGIMTNIRVKKIVVASGDGIDSIQFTYLVETKDKSIDVEGYRHGGIGGTKATWDLSSYFMLKLKGCSGASRTSIRQIEVGSVYPGNGNMWTWVAGNPTDNKFDMVVPTVFYSKYSNVGTGMLGDIGAYKGELYDADAEKWNNIFWTKNPDVVKTWYDKLLNQWKVDFSQQFPGGLGDDTLKAVKVKLDQLIKDNEDAFTKYKEANRLQKEAQTKLSDTEKERDQLKTDKIQLEKDKVTVEGERDTLKKGNDDLVEEWKTDFLTDFDKPLSVEGLKAVKERLGEMEKIINNNQEVWTNNFSEFGMVLNPESLEAVKAELNELEKDKQQAETDRDTTKADLKTANEKIIKYEKQATLNDLIDKKWKETLGDYGDSATIGGILSVANKLNELKTDNAKKDTALAEKDNTISNLNQQIAKATTADEEKLKLLQNELNKKNELISQLNQYKEEILKTKRVNVKKDLTLFYQGIGLDDDPLKKKYNGDFISIINEKLSLDNEENMKKAFKVVACICATEKAQEWTKGVTNPGPKLLSTLEKIRKGWEEVEKYPQISKENNSFYLDIIAKRQEYKKEFDGLIGKYKQTKRTIEVRGITGQSTVSLSAKDLAEERTIFQISKKEGIKEKFKGYLDLLKKEYPGAKEAIEKIENEKEVKENLENYSDGTNTEDWLILIRSFTNDETIIAKIKEGAEAKVKKIFSSDASDDDIVKDLKTQPLDSLLSDLALYKGDEIVYATELIEKFYLGWLSKHVQEVLTKEEPSLSLANLDKKDWEVIKQKVFADLYGSWENTTGEGQIENLREKISADVVELDDLIAKARKEEKDKFEKWIKENISDKTKVEDLPSEADIDNHAELPSSAKQQAKWKLQEKKIELMPETTVEGRIKKHLLRVKFDWERWDYLVKQKDQTNSADYAMALMFAESFGKTVAQEMLPKVIAAITKDTMEGYRNLDQEWGQNLLEDDGVKYNENRDYYDVWKTLREYLHEEKANKDKWMKTYLEGIRGKAKFEQIEKQQQSLQTHIEVPTTNNK